MTLAPSELATWQRLADEATPGPWFGPRITDQMPPGWIGVYEADANEDGTIDPLPGYVIGMTGHMEEEMGAQALADAAFIASARDAVPRLLAEVARLQALQPAPGDCEYCGATDNLRERDRLTSDLAAARAALDAERKEHEEALDFTMATWDEKLGGAMRAADAARAELATVKADNEAMAKALSLIGEWTHVYGEALKPRRADTYGEGMRDAKEQVSNLVARASRMKEPHE